MRYQITHCTTYNYASEVSVSHHVARVAPRALPRQTCPTHDLAVDPAPSLTNARDDYFGNRAAFFTITGSHRRLVVTARSAVEVQPTPPLNGLATPPWESVRALFTDASPAANGGAEAQEFVFPSTFVPRLSALADYAAESFPAERPTLVAVLDLTKRMRADLKFDPKATTVATPLEQVLRQRRGVCQDFAHFQIGCLRALGLPARYVSGYLETIPPAGQARLVGADASHAWVQAYIPPVGWIDVDPTNNVLPSDRHITVAWGRDFDDVSPIRGVIIGGGRHTLSVAVDVAPEATAYEGLSFIYFGGAQFLRASRKASGRFSDDGSDGNRVRRRAGHSRGPVFRL